MMKFDVHVVLKGRDFAVTESIENVADDPSGWTDDSVRRVLVEILRTIDRVANPGAPADRQVVLRGFSWIVEPSERDVVIAIEIPTGAAVAGPFAIGQADLDARITRVLRAEQRPPGAPVVH